MNALATIPAARNMVYFVQSSMTGSVKIGWSADLRARLTALQTGSDSSLYVLRKIQGGRPTERWLHRRFADLNVRGEWFEYCPDMLTVIPPDEIIAPLRVVKRRDVRLTVREKFALAGSRADETGLSDKQMLLTFIADLSDAHAREIREYISAELWEIGENLHRLDLTKEQRDEHIRRYAELIEARTRQVRQNDAPVLSDGRKSGPQHGKGVARKIAEETGLSARTVQRALNPPALKSDPPKEVFDVHEQARKRMMNAWNAATETDRQWFRDWIDNPIMDGMAA